MITSLIIAGGIILALITIGLIFTKLYKKSSKQMAFVRTGFGGEKIILNGGALVFPILHEVMNVNMNTLKLEVRKNKEEALITKDRLRIDIIAEFHVRVAQDKDSVSRAAQTLGSKTLDPTQLKALIEGKMVNTLRSVAAEMEMEELHEKREDFVQRVQSTVLEDLSKNGLELESVSLTGLDQTDKQYFNPENAFDAQGLKKLAESIEKRKKERNDIEKENEIAIQKRNLEAKEESLKLTLQEKEAELKQEEDIAKKTAIQASTIAQEEANRRKEAETAKIQANQEIETKQIEKDKALKEAEIQKDKALKEAEIQKDKELNIANQNKQIAIYEKSQEEFKAQTEANIAKKEEVESAEKIKTAELLEIENRKKDVQLIEADKNAEIVKKEANAKAEAIITIAEAKEKEMSVDAEGKSKLYEAENSLSMDILQYRMKTAFIENLPGIIASMTKPMEKIDSIKIVDMNGVSQKGNGGVVNGGGSLPDNVVNAALRYKTEVPFVEDMLKTIGINGGLENLKNLVSPSIVELNQPEVLAQNNAQETKIEVEKEEESLA